MSDHKIDTHKIDTHKIDTHKIDKRDWDAHPPYVYPDYKSTTFRGPTKPLVPIAHTLSELTIPAFGHEQIQEFDNDLTINGRVDGEPQGERIQVSGRVLDEYGRPQIGTLVEIWQANAAGRYIHKTDQHDAPIDPNFFGGGRCVTDENGRYTFLSIKPGAYPWGNHHNAWRPNHIHFSLFGMSFASRLVTQMYFPGDPLLALDPIFNATADKIARESLVSKFSQKYSIPNIALGYEFDIVLRGPAATPMEA
ncbi:MAG: protocatechuate 3,4-dioxygenase subunit beta [Kordiimonadaceae bacterium]|jgi:protocatechuate 3,4-dioxygenase, beta subunit|nr:protocatechuate 3,4-dioxygenase subunit beta [Kordiimonadaceae bacterium]MBT6031363.1 protocatechuate 3,4-dioxygenase subunit beta [Kordiimonadaceae bacterium]